MWNSECTSTCINNHLLVLCYLSVSYLSVLTTNRCTAVWRNNVPSGREKGEREFLLLKE